MSEDIGACRSFLYMPGDRPAMLAKAFDRGADALIIDLEDAVAAADKERALDIVGDWLAEIEPGGHDIWVRVNNHPDLLEAELNMLAPLGSLTGFYVPKVEGVDVLSQVSGLVGDRPVIALIESGRGLMNLLPIADHPSTVMLAAGEADLAADLGVSLSPDEREFLSFRMQLVAASAAAGIAGPTGPVSTDFSDPAAMEQSSRALRNMGFGGRAAIHPAQVDPINRAFTPTEQELAWAKTTVGAAAAAGSGAYTDAAGNMVDEAIVRRARRVVSLQAAIDARSGA